LAEYVNAAAGGDDEEEEDIRQEDMVGVGFIVDDLRIWELRERNSGPKALSPPDCILKQSLKA